MLGRGGPAVLQWRAGAAERLHVPGRRGRAHRRYPMVARHALSGLHGRIRLPRECPAGGNLQFVEPAQRGPRPVLGECATERAGRRSPLRQSPVHHRLGPVERMVVVPGLWRRRSAKGGPPLPDIGPGPEGIRPFALELFRRRRRPPRPARHLLDPLHARIGQPASRVGLRFSRPFQLLSRRRLLSPFGPVVAGRAGSSRQRLPAHGLALRRKGVDGHGEPLESQRLHAARTNEIRGRGRRAGAGDRFGPPSHRLDVEAEPRRPPRPGLRGGLQLYARGRRGPARAQPAMFHHPGSHPPRFFRRHDPAQLLVAQRQLRAQRFHIPVGPARSRGQGRRARRGAAADVERRSPARRVLARSAGGE